MKDKVLTDPIQQKKGVFKVETLIYTAESLELTAATFDGYYTKKDNKLHFHTVDTAEIFLLGVKENNNSKHGLKRVEYKNGQFKTVL